MVNKKPEARALAVVEMSLTALSATLSVIQNKMYADEAKDKEPIDAVKLIAEPIKLLSEEVKLLRQISEDLKLTPQQGVLFIIETEGPIESLQASLEPIFLQLSLIYLPNRRPIFP